MLFQKMYISQFLKFDTSDVFCAGHMCIVYIYMYYDLMISEQLTLVCLGPLTNVAMALKMDPSFGENLKECHIMGGNYHGR